MLTQYVLMRAVVSLVIILLGITVFAWIVRYWQRTRIQNFLEDTVHSWAVISRTPLTRDATLVVISNTQRTLTLGVTPHTITPILDTPVSQSVHHSHKTLEDRQ